MAKEGFQCIKKVSMVNPEIMKEKLSHHLWFMQILNSF